MAYMAHKRRHAGAGGGGGEAEAANPFAAFLARRPTETFQKTKPEVPVPFTGYAPTTVNPPTALIQWHDGPTEHPYDPEMDTFAAFMTRRPLNASQERDRLQCEVMRTKKQLLELAVGMESEPPPGETGEEEAARLRRLAMARRYLDHPERILEPLSHSSVAVSEAGGVSVSVDAPGASLVEGSSASGQAPGSAGGSGPGGGLARPASASSEVTQAPPAQQRALSRSSSAAALAAPATAARPAASVLSRSGSGASLRSAGAMLLAVPAVAAVQREEVLNRWAPQVRAFNLINSKEPTEVRRRSSQMVGGTMAIGNGPMPLSTGEHLLNEGYSCIFRVVATDDERHPGHGAFALGVSRMPPTDTRLQGPRVPLYAYDVPDSVMLGYGARYIEERKWYSTPWDSSTLKLHDKVTMLVTLDGDLIVFVNDKQVCRVETKLGRSSKEEPHKLYPLIDLGGRAGGLLLCPAREPPCIQLKSRSRIERLLH